MSTENPLPACPRTVYIAEGETWHRYHDDRDCPRLGQTDSERIIEHTVLKERVHAFTKDSDSRVVGVVVDGNAVLEPRVRCPVCGGEQ